MAQEMDKLQSLVDADEILLPNSPLYARESRTWAVNRNQQPKVLIRPKSIDSLSKTLAYLSTTNLKFAVRSQGFGSASAKDVIISMTAFDEFHFDKENMSVTLGAGQPWRDYYTKMEEAAPEYTVVACRTPAIGVGGSIIGTGFSWLSAEFGNVSDPNNLLDAQFVKLDGTVVWGSEEPDLLWAIRGAEIGVAVVTAFRLRARPYSQKVWSGPIYIPRSSLNEIVKGAVGLAKKELDPKVGMFMYLLERTIMKSLGADDDMVVVHCFDALGEEHGRNEFKWALDIPGSMDGTKVMNLRQVASLQEAFSGLQGTMKSFWQPIALRDINDDIIFKAVDWYSQLLQTPGSIKEHVYLIFELFCTRDPLVSKDEMAWPRPTGFRHTMLLGTGCSPDSDAEEEQKAIELIRRAPSDILGDTQVDIVPNATEYFHDFQKMYGQHYEKLRELKKKYDPKNQMSGTIKA